MKRFSTLVIRFFLYVLVMSTGFLLFASVLPACKTTPQTLKSFRDCLESQEEVPLSTWIEVITYESLQAIPTQEVLLTEDDHLAEIIRQVQTVIVRPKADQEGIYEELVYTTGLSSENDTKAAQAINALRIENGLQTNINVMNDEENVLHITNIFTRDPLYEDTRIAANLLVCNALAHDSLPFLEDYPSYFSFSVDETSDQVIITWSCNDLSELNEAIQNTYLAKAGIRLTKDFEEQIICDKQGVLQKAQWTTDTSYGVITLGGLSDPNQIQMYLDQLFASSHSIGDPIEAYPLAETFRQGLFS